MMQARKLGLKGFEGVGDLGDCTPTQCAGPYTNPQYNYDYQQQLVSTGDQNQPVYVQEIKSGAPLWDYDSARAMVPYTDPGIPPNGQIVDCNEQADNAFNQWWQSNNGVHPATERFTWNGCDSGQFAAFMANQPIGTGQGYRVSGDPAAATGAGQPGTVAAPRAAGPGGPSKPLVVLNPAAIEGAISQPLSVAGFSFPLWAWALAALGVVAAIRR